MDLKILETYQPSVLIVEPSRHFASLLRHILSVGGVRDVRYATDAYGALEVIKSDHVDIVMLDSDLSGISAFELTRVIRRASDSPDQALPVILLSDRPTRRLINEAMLAGVDCFVRKPVSADTLLQRIKWCLDPATTPEGMGATEDGSLSNNTPHPDIGGERKIDSALSNKPLDDDYCTLDDTDDPLAILAV